jgi:hypothetical protein
VNGDYLLGFTFNSSSNQADWNAGTGFTRRQDLRVASYTVASEDATQSAAGAAAATFTATAGAVGEFITGILALQPRQGPAPTLVSIAVTPVNPSIGNGSTQPFTATGTYSDSSTQNLTGAAAWTSSNTGAATVSSTGVATGVGVGTTTIQAAFGGVTGSTTLTVTAPVITVAVSPASASVPVTGKQQFTATVTNDSQNAGVTWNLSGAGCSGSTCGTLSTSSSSSGTPITYTAPSSAPTPQTVTLTATSVSDPARTAAATITITLADTAPMYIDFEGATDGTTINASVMAASTHCGNGSWSYFTDSPMTGMTISTTAQRSLVAPVTTCGTRYTDSAGTRGLRYDMSQVGKYAAYHWNTTSSSASVGFYYKIDVVDSNWYSVFAITAQGHDYVMLHMHGGAMYIETWAGITDPIPISPKTWYWVTMQYNAGATHYMRVYDATTWALLGSVSNVATGNWTPDGIEIGRTGSEPGYPAAYWYYDNFIVDYVNGTFPIVQGTPTALTSIAVTPSNPSIAKGTTQPFTATGTYSDGTTQNLTATVAWTSSNTSVATISGGGVASGTGVGTATIQAKSGSVTGSTTLTVTAPVLSSIAVNPPSPSIPVGAAQAFTATGTYSDGSTQNLTGSVTWSSSNAAVATMSGAVASAVGIGNSTIQAASGPVTGSTTLTVTAALSSIAVTPTNPSIPKGTSQSFVATATYSDGSTSNVTGSVSWTSTNSSVATMSGALAFAVSTGSTTIQATSGSVTGSTTLTVTPALLSSIAVTPANPTIVVGSTQAFTATGTYSDGTTQNLTATATWSSSNTLVATIASTGVATGVAAGTTTIGAASGAITGSTTLTISSAAAITYVQSASGNDHYSTATAAAKFANAVTASDVIAVLCAWTGTTQTLTRVSDTQGNAYTIVDNPTSGSYGRAAMAYAVAGVSGPDTVTCTFSSASMGKSVVAHEIGGVNAAVPLDGHKMTVRLSPGTGANAISSGAITTTVNGDYLLGFTFNSSSNQADWNAGTGFTRRQDLRVASYTVASEDAIQSAAGAAAATFTATAGAVGEFITGILALRPR